MIRFLLRRLAWFAATLLAVVTIAFALMRAVPGGPFDGDRELHPAVERNLRARYHLDWPLWKQYLQYVGPLNLDDHGARALGGDGARPFGGVLAGDLGPSLRYRDLSVGDVLSQSLPSSLALGIVALVFALGVGLPAGIAAAAWRGTRADLALRLAATLGLALPNFVIASVLVIVFAFALPWFPVAGHGTWRHLVLPGVALGAPFAAYAARLVRTSMLETLSADHVRTARALGLPWTSVLLRHALPAALLPVLSWLGPAAAGILTGSLVIERLFAIPGAGSHFVLGALNRDYTLAMGVTILYTVLVYALNLAVDLAYAAIDPRIGLGEARR